MNKGLALAALLVAAGCAGPRTEALLAEPGRLPPVARVASVPFYPQAEKACGPAALAMALAWSGAPVAPEALASLVFTPGRDGSLPPDMITAARREGRLAVRLHGLRAVLAEMSAGHPVVVLQNLGLEMRPVWHFAVAVGYDLPARRIVLHSGLEERAAMGLDTFEHTWVRAGQWAVVVLPPDRLPAGGGERDTVEAAAGIERAGRLAAAEAAYRAVLSRWPESLAAAVGLGNVRYRLGDGDGAAEAFRMAVDRHPGAAAAWNNLAHVQLELGRLAGAEDSALRAVELGGAEGPYAATLAEVRAARVAATSSASAR